MKKPTRHLKIFISSTFQDMQEEREVLLKDTFLTLKKIAKSRDVEITEIDLRTGITKEQEQSGDIVKICLDEIERCADSPIFFLGMLGNRYGWDEWHKHTNKETLDNQKYTWVNQHIGCSVTELEILSAIENSKNNKAFLFLKDSKENDDKRLIILKNKLIRKSHDNSELLVRNYKNLDDFREQTIETFTKALDELYPKDEKVSEVEKVRASHQAFSKSRQKVYISHPKNKSILDEFIAGKEDRLLLYGESGYGKSALIANYFENFKQSSHSFVIEHYIGGAGEQSNDLHQMLSRVMLEIKEEFKLEDKIPTEPQKIMDEFALWLHKVKRPTIIVLDGYNQIEDALKEKLFYYIPEKLEKVKIIITSIKKDYPIENSYQIEALNQEEQRELIISYLKVYGKTINKPIQNEIIKHPQTNNTLFLRTLLNEIRLLGSFDNLDKDIVNYLQAKNVVELFIKIFERLEHDYRENLSKEVLSLLYVSRDGLSEDNLIEIINQNSEKKLTRLEFSPLFLAIESHLIDRGGLYGFFHDYIREAVESIYLNSEEFVNIKRREIIDYFIHREINTQIIREVPFQLFQLKDRSRLYKCLIDLTFFVFLKVSNSYELLLYIQYIDEDVNFNISATVTQKALEENCTNAYMVGEIATFLHLFYTEYEQSLLLYKKSIDIYNDQLGLYHFNSTGMYNNLSLLYQLLGEYDKSLEILLKVLQINKKNLDKHDSELSANYSNIASTYRLMEQYDNAIIYYKEALNIKHKDNHEKAIVYDNMAMAYFDKGRYETAIILAKKALALFIKYSNEIHPDIATNYSNLATIYLYMGNYSKALLIQKKSLKILKNIFDTNHQGIAIGYLNMGHIYKEMQDYNNALLFLNKSLVINKIIFNENHDSLASNYQAIAQVYLYKKEYEKSLIFNKKSLKILKNIFNEKNSLIAISYSDLGVIYQQMKDYDNSLYFSKKSLMINKEIFGDFHSYTASNYYNIGSVFFDIKEYKKSYTYITKAINIWEKMLPSNHKDLLYAKEGLNAIEKQLQTSSISPNIYINNIDYKG